MGSCEEGLCQLHGYLFSFLLLQRLCADRKKFDIDRSHTGKKSNGEFLRPGPYVPEHRSLS
jgi:hypothetical protein